MHLIIYLRNSIVFVYQARSDARYVDKHKRWREGVKNLFMQTQTPPGHRINRF